MFKEYNNNNKKKHRKKAIMFVQNMTSLRE